MLLIAFPNRVQKWALSEKKKIQFTFANLKTTEGGFNVGFNVINNLHLHLHLFQCENDDYYITLESILNIIVYANKIQCTGMTIN